jgi:hypothetical protein
MPDENGDRQKTRRATIRRRATIKKRAAIIAALFYSLSFMD